MADTFEADRSTPRTRPPTSLSVALVTQGFATGGGIPATTRWLRQGLEAAGHRVEIFDLANSRTDPYSRRLVSPRSWVRASLKGPSSEDVRRWGANLVEVEVMRYRPRRELDRELDRYDIVQVVSGTPSLARVTRRLRTPTALMMATMVQWERQAQQEAGVGPTAVWRRAMTALHARLEEPALKDADYVFTINEAAAEHVRALGQDAVATAPPGVDVERFVPHPQGWQQRGALLSVCRLADPRKRLDRLVRAYGRLVEDVSGVPDLILAGRGQLGPAVQTLIDELGLEDRIDVRSDVPADQLPELVRAASVFLQSSQEEGLGISVLEAMASGVPVVATETYGTLDTVEDGVTGHLIPQVSEEQIVSDFVERVAATLDSDGAAMGAAARRRVVATFSKEVNMRRVTDVYAALASRGVA